MIHPFASAIDSPKLDAPETMVIILNALSAIQKLIIAPRLVFISIRSLHMFNFQRVTRKSTVNMAQILWKAGTRNTMSIKLEA